MYSFHENRAKCLFSQKKTAIKSECKKNNLSLNLIIEKHFPKL